MIFVDTNVVSETFRKAPSPVVIDWLVRHDEDLAMPTTVIGEILYGIEKIRPDPRAARLEGALARWRDRLAGRIYGFDTEAAVADGVLFGQARRLGRPMSPQDAMIAAITLVNGGVLATRNLTDFSTTGLHLVSPWDA